MAWKQLVLTRRLGDLRPRSPTRRLATTAEHWSDSREAIRPATVEAGTMVCVEDSDTAARYFFTLVAPHAGEATGPLLSVLSPWGRALLGAQVGDTVELVGNRSSRRLRVVAIQRAP
jgi:transcription elongation GreA/GreB family factor